MKNAHTRKHTAKGEGVRRTTAPVEDAVVRMTLAEARERSRRGEGRTDLAALDAMTDEDIERAIDADPDAAPRLEGDFWRAATLLTAAAEAPKTTVTLRVDTDVLNTLKRQGPGYQSRINAVLRAYVNTLQTR